MSDFVTGLIVGWIIAAPSAFIALVILTGGRSK